MSALAKIASDYGPFLFAILFVMSIPSRIHSQYREDLKAFPSPDASQQRLIDESRLHYRCAWGFGVALVIVSIGWWVYLQHDIQKLSDEGYTLAYTGEIYGVTDTDVLSDPDQKIYFEKAYISHDVFLRYVFLSSKELTSKQLVDLRYINAKDTDSHASGGYGGQSVPFAIDPSIQAYELKTDGTQTTIVPDYKAP